MLPDHSELSHGAGPGARRRRQDTLLQGSGHSGQILEAVKEKIRVTWKESKKIQSACDRYGCHWLRLCSDFSVLWTTSFEVESQIMQLTGVGYVKRKNSSFELWRRLHPVALGVQTQRSVHSRRFLVSYMQVGLGLACGLSFVRKLQQTSRWMTQTSSFFLRIAANSHSMLQNVTDILWPGLADSIYGYDKKRLSNIAESTFIQYPVQYTIVRFSYIIQEFLTVW